MSAAANPNSAPQPVSSQPTQSAKQHNFDLALSLHLHLWPALSLAVAEAWGGPASADKRDWLAGALSDLFAERPDTSQEDVEDVLCQVMADEFDVQLEDGSEEEVARDIARSWRLCMQGDFGEVDGLRERWERVKGKGVVRGVRAGGEDEEDDDDEDEDEESGGVGLDDVEMGDAQGSAQVRDKPPAPEVDDEGFTTVVSKKRR